MKNIILIFLFLWIISCKSESSENISTIENHESEDVLTKLGQIKLDSVCSSYVNNKSIAGVSALIARDGHIIYESNIGMQNIESNKTIKSNTLYNIASMTKPITTVAFLILQEQGKVNLNDLASEYIPEFKNAKVIQEDGNLKPIETPLTLKHFLMHTAGLLPQNHEMFREVSPYSKETLEDCVNTIAELPLIHEPGASFTYGASTNIIARVVEIVSGEKINEFVQKNIFSPLKMKSTYYFVPESEKSRIASLYTPDGNLTFVFGPEREDAKFAKGTNGIYSTARDYFRFAQMLLNEGELDGVRILKKETIKSMTSDQLAENLHPLNVMGTSFPKTGFGLGLAILNGELRNWKPLEYSFAHLGNFPAGSYYWPGVTGTYWWADPAHNIIGILLTQTSNPAAHPVLQDFAQTFYSNSFYKEIN